MPKGNKRDTFASKRRKLKTRLHFNRVNMQRKKPQVWTAHNSQSCNQAEKLIIRHNGKVLLETVYDPDGRQPRAFFSCYGTVVYEGNSAVIEV